jgi:hypothetical protein
MLEGLQEGSPEWKGFTEPNVVTMACWMSTPILHNIKRSIKSA